MEGICELAGGYPSALFLFILGWFVAFLLFWGGFLLAEGKHLFNTIHRSKLDTFFKVYRLFRLLQKEFWGEREASTTDKITTNA